VAEEPVSLFVPHVDPDEQAFRDAVAAAMVTLPEEQRAVVHLKLWENLSFSEIGHALDLSPNTVASRYRYALDKLEHCLCAGAVSTQTRSLSRKARSIAHCDASSRAASRSDQQRTDGLSIDQ
jgi:DNA-directed RNA polymerase specialized sigma24 family protein